MDVDGLCPRRKVGGSLEQQARFGEYFRASIWQWRPILCLSIEAELNEDELDVDFQRWRYNGGAGLTTQRECDLLADAIESNVRHAFDPEDPFAADPFFDDFIVYADEHGEPWIVRQKEDEEDDDYHRRNYWTTGRHVWQWIAFLRNCGGFAIW
jgi:hypothetical protein